MNIALLLSGGTGTRLGAGIPKQYIDVGGRPVISYCIRCLSVHNAIDAIQIVADPSWQGHIWGWLDREDVQKKFRGFSVPGENRQLSILHGLEDIHSYADETDYVFVHDAARPLLSVQMTSQCLRAVKGHDGLVPVLPMKDTVYMSAGGHRITSLLNRSEVFAGQAPEVFQLGKYLAANRKLMPERILQVNGAAEPAVMAGMDIVLIPGDEENFKITTKADLERFRRITSAQDASYTDKYESLPDNTAQALLSSTTQ